MEDKQELKFAIGALTAGLVWGYIRNRGDSRAPVFAMLQGIEWFVAYGGASALIQSARGLLEQLPEEGFGEDRISHFREVVTERTGTDG